MPLIDVAQVDRWMSELFAPWVQELGLILETIDPGHVTFLMPVTPRICRLGGTLSGQAMMAAADTAMVIAVASQLGEFRPLTTVSMSSHFLRPVAFDAQQSQAPMVQMARVIARVVKPGRHIMFGEMQIENHEAKLAAQFVATYALL
jgi:uncharacterized protein (TIGR00369 family)